MIDIPYYEETEIRIKFFDDYILSNENDPALELKNLKLELEELGECAAEDFECENHKIEI